MAKLPKYTLTHNEKKERWDLDQRSDRSREGQLRQEGRSASGRGTESELGKAGGSVKIQKANGRYQEERTYPGSADRKSPRDKRLRY